MSLNKYNPLLSPTFEFSSIGKKVYLVKVVSIQSFLFTLYLSLFDSTLGSKNDSKSLCISISLKLQQFQKACAPT